MDSTSDSADHSNDENNTPMSFTKFKETNEYSEEVTKYLCLFCGNLFVSVFSVKRHQKVCPSSPLSYKAPGKNYLSFQCHKCGKLFKHREYMTKHAASCSGSSAPRNVPCLYETCSETFYHKTSLIEHLKHQHNAEIEERKMLQFKNRDTFLAWKEEEEQKTFSYFSKKMGEKNNVSFYYCQHDGSSKPHLRRDIERRVTNRRNFKGQIKTGKTCLARIRSEIRKDGKVIVQYDPTHSHPLRSRDAQHHPLSAGMNKEISEQLEVGRSPEEIAYSILNKYSRKEFHPSKSNYENLVGRIKERVRKMRIRSRSDPDDAESVMKKVVQMQNEDHCPIILFKPKGMEVVIGPDSINKCDDTRNVFMIGIQTKEQLEMMQSRSNLIVSVDLMHDTNQYAYQLLSMVVPDEFGRGFPVGQFITSKMNEETISCFASAIRERASDLKISCVLTANDSVIINGLNRGFQSELNHILCHWDVYENFRKNLKKYALLNKAEVMFEALCSITNCETKEDFEEMLDDFYDKYRTEAPKFARFMDTSLSISHKWAKCYRTFPHDNIDTLMLNESVNNVLKTMYMKRIRTKRLDNLIDLILKMAKDFHTRLEKDRMLEMPYGLDDPINDRHEEGMKIPDECVVEMAENKQWEVSSQLYRGQKYKILRLIEVCNSDMCYTCHSSCYALCTHLYFCTCADLCVLCKHIHKVHSLRTKDVPVPCDEDVELIELKFYVDSDCEDSLLDVKQECDQKKADIIQTIDFLSERIRNDELSDSVLSSIDFTVSGLVQACEGYRDEQVDKVVDSKELLNGDEKGISKVSRKRKRKCSELSYAEI